MALEQKLQVKLSQKLMLTPALQQAIRLLQLNSLELKQEIMEQLLENPVLEEMTRSDGVAETSSELSSERELSAGEGDNLAEVDVDAFFQDALEATSTAPPRERYELGREAPNYEAFIASPESLEEHLVWQVAMSPVNDQDRKIAEFLCGNLNSEGYLKMPPEEVATTLRETFDRVEMVRGLVMSLDPVGCGATSLPECLLAQLADLGEGANLARQLLLHHKETIEQDQGDVHALAGHLGIPEDDLAAALRTLRSLDPHPGLNISGSKPDLVIPDVFVIKVGHRYRVTLNDEGAPPLRLSNRYRTMMRETNDRTTKKYLREHVRNAMWFVRSIEERRKTIYNVAKAIVEHQQDFFENGPMGMHPLLLKDVAEEVGVHESTVSRVVNQKWMHTPRGTLAMKFFFSGGFQRSGGEDLSVLQVKGKIKALIQQEEVTKPWSDDKIAKELKRGGLEIARRTVAKYREEMEIPSSSKRRVRTKT